MSDAVKRLEAIYNLLDEQGRASLLDFAEFLAERAPEQVGETPVPQHVPRPEDESVMAAIKRLSDVYHMIDRSKMLHETSGLMAQHVMQGRAASEVIDELEELFERYYQKQFGEVE